MRYSSVKILAAAAALALSGGVAHAAIVTGTYTAVGSNFTSSVPPPYASITESFTVTFNNATTVSQQTVGISLNSASTIIPTSTLAYTYVAASDSLIVGGIASTVSASDPSSTDFSVVIQNASNTANFSVTAVSYSVGTGAIFSALKTAVGTPPTSAVPEPASLALLAAAGAAFAATRRRSRG